MSENRIPVIEWLGDGFRSFNPATGDVHSASTAEQALTLAGNPNRVGLCLGRKVAFVRETRTPNVAKDEARPVVQIQLNTLFPIAAEELAFDFIAGESANAEGVSTSVAAARTVAVRDVVKAIESNGAKVEWVAPTALGSAQIAASDDEAVVVDSENGDMTMDVVKSGVLVYSRSINTPEEVSRRDAELARTMAAASLNGATVYASNNEAVSSSTVQSPVSSLEAMASHSAGTINIELPEIREKRLKQSTQNKSRLAILLWVAVIAVGSLTLFDRFTKQADVNKIEADRTKQKQAVQTQIATVQGDSTTIGKQVEVIARSGNPAQPATDVITLISNSVPDGAWITGLTYERGKEVQMRGTAVNADLVSLFTANLAINERLRDIELQFANDSEIENIPVVQFSLSAHVVGNLPLIEGSRSTRRSR